MNKKSLVFARDVVQRFNISYQMLNYYTTLGILDNAGRQGLRRLYDARQVRARLKTVRQLQNKGYPLKLIVETLRAQR